MKFVILLLAVIGTTSGLTCKTSASGAATSCDKESCSKPKFNDYTGYEAAAYACGPCTGTTKADGKCEECTTDDCNKPAVLATENNKCYSYTIETGEGTPPTEITKNSAATTCQILKTTTTVKCNMPAPTSTKTTYTSTSGCGPCKADQKSAGTCKECDGENCNVMTAIKCVQGADGTVAAKDCPLTATKCFMPKFVEYTGLVSGVEYGCGECKSGTTDKCETCEGSATACNKAIETGTDFKCNTFTWSATNKNFTAAETTCKRKKTTTDVACNMPAEYAINTNYTSTSGCGPCKTAEKDKGCKQCAKEMCNKPEEKKGSATTITALALPLLAIIYMFF